MAMCVNTGNEREGEEDRAEVGEVWLHMKAAKVSVSRNARSVLGGGHVKSLRLRYLSSTEAKEQQVELSRQRE